MGRIVAIDFGLARCGIAITDPLKIIAQPLICLPNDVHFIEKLKAYGPFEKIVIGLPLHMNGKESPMAQQVRAFAAILEQKLAVPIVFWDERLTSAQAERTLKEANLSRKERSKKNDTLAATLILESFLQLKRFDLGQ
jgi:putative Holliday junction resolvase